MLQRGIQLQNLDPSYVSSLSLYFLTLFGLRGLFSIVLGGDNGTECFQVEANELTLYFFSIAADDTKLLQQQAATGGMMGGGPAAMPGLGGMKPDPDKPFKEERTELTIHVHHYTVHLAQFRLIGINSVQ